ncbi:MAG: AraC family transcriptional regulator [Coprococcus sp.]
MARTTHRQVADIALECGFSSVSYFIKQFKNIVGCTYGL